jgi:hypothetical protein
LTQRKTFRAISALPFCVTRPRISSYVSASPFGSVRRTWRMSASQIWSHISWSWKSTHRNLQPSE